MRISLRHTRRLLPEQPLHLVEIDTTLHERGREGMTHIVDRSPAIEASLLFESARHRLIHRNGQ